MSRRLTLSFALLCGLTLTGQQTEVRLNPELGDESVSAPVAASHPFVKTSANNIIPNGADWTPLRQAFAAADSQVVGILHIGDSHVQPEGNTSRVRKALQMRFGSAGRGLVAPLRIAGTNGPTDYTIKSAATFSTSRLMKSGWPAGMGMSGVAVDPAAEHFDMQVSATQPFDRVRVHTVGESPVEAEGVDGGLMAAYISPSAGVTELLLTRAVTAATLRLRAPAGTSVTALELLRGNHGVEYSAIGNNGAGYASYSSVPRFGESVARLHPQLIIVSLGTNEAFGRMTDDTMRSAIASLVGELQRHNPEAQILLTTPQECYKRSYTTTRRRKGRRRRRRVAGYAVNTNISRVRDVILDYASDNHLAVWDWYDVSGGAGTAQKWLAHNLMNKDRIHLTWDGYHLMGDLLADALMRSILSKPTETNHIDDESVR